ncbi:MAG: bifunctional acetate--CoA ligase family protein/GNAT family N-acetyltransferase [Candidatus Aenigmarchaeota archaeon]|nr:bifunctional acetate--CoA ligase family protein/GNAT family N-acetyltransferase [Candidatus Aenigmarchaeota archaeon]
MSKNNFKRIFNPDAIAVIGASNKKGSIGFVVMNNLIGGTYGGTVYPVNPKRKSVQGVKAYASVSDIPEKIDLVVIATPAKTVPGILEECGKQGVAGAVIISSGFKEGGKRGQEMCEDMLKISRRYGIRIIGPNCLGIIRPSLNMNASFAKNLPLPGKIAFISQSGALGTAIIDWSIEQNVGFSYFVSIGSMIDVGFHDLIDYFAEDPETSSVLIYMESLSDAKKFMSAARAFSRTKPIIVLKAGKSSEGASAAMSHTGTLAGNDAVFDAAFKRAGIIRVSNVEDLFNCAQTLSMQRRPLGNRLAIVTNAGGPGVIAVDRLVEGGGQLAKLSEKTLKALEKDMPDAWSRSNPVDILGDADHDRYAKAVELCIKDDGVDGVLVILTPQGVTDPVKVAEAVAEINKKYEKTLLASWMGGELVRKGKDILEEGKVPVYSAPEKAVKCFTCMHRYSRNISLLYETPATIPHAFKPKTKENRKIIKEAARRGKYALDEAESKKLLENYGIPVSEYTVARKPEEAAEFSSRTGFPVAMKILSPDIIHKTDIGGVRLDIRTKEEAMQAFRDLMKSAKKHKPKARIEGVFIEPMISKKYELLIGCKKDPIFGPSIVFGMGGIAVEVFKDTNVGLPPLNMALSMRIIEDTKIYRLLRGYRGMKGVDINAIQFLLYKFAYLVMDFPEIKEVDINPFAVDEKGGVVLDAKVLLDRELAGKRVRPYSHMVISPYPKEYITVFRMDDGRKAVLRPIRPEDEPMEGEMFTKFSKETQRFRFFSLIKDITHEMLIRYTQIDYDREIAIIAELDEDGKKVMAGVARLIADPYNETAEFAIVVADPWQHRGLGKRMTDYILEIAKKRGIKKVFANVLVDNYIMLNMLRKRGFSLKKTNEDTYYTELGIGRRKG